MSYARCILKPGKEKALRNYHPWIFSGAIDRIEEGLGKGDLVDVFSSHGDFLATGYFNPETALSVRVLTFRRREIDRDFFAERLESAVRLRASFSLPSGSTDCYRLVHAEGDGLPGLIVDVYGRHVVLQVLTAGIERWKKTILEILEGLLHPQTILERSSADFRAREGLEASEGLLYGDASAERIEVRENGNRFLVDLCKGQKTGFFLDQRDNRRLIGSLCRGRAVLNCFSYSGGFSVYAGAGGASRIVSVDSSAGALELARENMELNGLGEVHSAVEADCFEYLRRVEEMFDFIILDPPAFCKSRAHVEVASRGYKDINYTALKKLRPGGFLYTASCSSHISSELFQKIVFAAAKDAGRDLKITARTSHAPDHPVSIFHPEGEYLKGLLCSAV